MNEQIQFGIPLFRAFGTPFSPSRSRHVQGLLAFSYAEPRLPCALTVTLNALSVTDIPETQSSSRELGPLSPDGWCPARTFPARFGPRSRLHALPRRILTFGSVWAQLVRGLAVTGGKVGEWAPSVLGPRGLLVLCAGARPVTARGTRLFPPPHSATSRSAGNRLWWKYLYQRNRQCCQSGFLTFLLRPGC